MASNYQLDVKPDVKPDVQSGDQTQAVGDGTQAVIVTLGGVLDFDSVPDILQKMESVIIKHTSVTLDLAAVSSANSAALALLVELRKHALSVGHTLQFRAIPDSIMKIARVCEADTMLTAG